MATQTDESRTVREETVTVSTNQLETASESVVSSSNAEPSTQNTTDVTSESKSTADHTNTESATTEVADSNKASVNKNPEEEPVSENLEPTTTVEGSISPAKNIPVTREAAAEQSSKKADAIVISSSESSPGKKGEAKPSAGEPEQKRDKPAPSANSAGSGFMDLTGSSPEPELKSSKPGPSVVVKNVTEPIDDKEEEVNSDNDMAVESITPDVEEKDDGNDDDDDVQIIEWDKPPEWFKKVGDTMPYWREVGMPSAVVFEIIKQWVRIEKRKSRNMQLQLETVSEKLGVSIDEIKVALSLDEGKVPLGLPSKSLPRCVQKFLEKTWTKMFEWQKARKKQGLNMGWDLYTTQCYTKMSNPDMISWRGIKRAMKLMVDVEVVDVNRKSARSKLQFESVVTMKHFTDMYKEVYAIKPRKVFKDILWTWKYFASKRKITIEGGINAREFEMIKELAYRLARKKGMPKALTRYNVADSACDSWVFGWSMKRYIKAGEKRTTQASANSKNANCRRIYHLLKALIDERHESFQYTSITVNRNLQCKPHRDKRNVGLSYIIAFGAFEGGGLNYEICPGWTETFALKNKWLLFNGNDLHGNTPFTGTRFSCVFYKHSTIAKELEGSATDEQRKRGINYKPP